MSPRLAPDRHPDAVARALCNQRECRFRLFSIVCSATFRAALRPPCCSGVDDILRLRGAPAYELESAFR